MLIKYWLLYSIKMEFKEFIWADWSRYTGDFVWNDIQGL